MTEISEKYSPITDEENEEARIVYACLRCGHTKKLVHLWTFIKCDVCGGAMMKKNAAPLLGDPAEN